MAEQAEAEPPSLAESEAAQAAEEPAALTEATVAESSEAAAPAASSEAEAAPAMLLSVSGLRACLITVRRPHAHSP